MLNQSQTSTFVAVTCPCGKILRAKEELAGSEIRCWDCRKMVLVPFPRQVARVARELSEGALGVIQGPGLNSVLAASAFITALLSIPHYGPWCAVAGLTLAGFAYGEIIRRFSRGPVEEPDPDWAATLVPRSVPKSILSLLMAAGTVVPLWLWNAGIHRSPHWDWISRTIAATAWTVVPLLIWIAFASDREGRLGIKRCLKLAARHRMAFLLALTIVPVVLVLLEAGFGLILYIQGILPFYALEFMPAPESLGKPMMLDGCLYFGHMDYRYYPQSIFYRAYFDGLRHGYSFSGAIPASLSLSTRAGMSSSVIHVYGWLFFPIRAFITLIVVTCLLTGFAIQARWLGAIASLEKRRPA